MLLSKTLHRNNFVRIIILNFKGPIMEIYIKRERRYRRLELLSRFQYSKC